MDVFYAHPVLGLRHVCIYPHPVSLPTGGREAFSNCSCLIMSALDLQSEEAGEMPKSPSPLWEGIEGGGKNPHPLHEHFGAAP